MISELDKNILNRIIVSEKPLSGSYLSEICHISINTLRKEISIINDYLKEYCCHIDTKISIGYRLIIDDEEVALPFLERIIREINRFSYLSINDSQKENYLIRRILCANSTISIEQLMDELYCSKSTILRLIDKTIEYLDHFHLTIKMKRNSGLYIEGTEWHKRLCLIHQHKIYKHAENIDNNNIELNAEHHFDAMLLNNTSYHNEIRTIFLSLISNYPDLAYAHFDIASIINFIILCKTRHFKADELEFTKEQIEKYHNSTCYKFALEIVDNLPQYIASDFKEKEIDSLTIYLSGLRKYKKHFLNDSTESKRLLTITHDLLDFICTKFEVRDLIDYQLVSDLALFIKEQENVFFCDVFKDSENYSLIIKSGLFSSDIAALLVYYLDKKQNLKLGPDAIGKAYSIFNRAFYDNNNFYNQQNILLISRYSLYYANNVAERIKDNYAKVIKNIDTCEYTDIPLVDLDQYDAIFTDIAKDLFSIGMPIVEIEFKRTDRDFMKVNRYINETFKKEALKIFTKDALYKQQFDNKLDCLSFIYDLLNDHRISKEDWLQDCLQREQYITFERNKEIVLVSNLNYRTEKPIFKLIISPESFEWKKKLCHVIIYYNFGDGTKKSFQDIAYIIKQFIHQDEAILSAINNMSYEEILDFFSFENSYPK